jgi:hypothetical protein
MQRGESDTVKIGSVRQHTQWFGESAEDVILTDWFPVFVPARSPEPDWSDMGVLAVQAKAVNWPPNGLFCIGSCSPRLSRADNQTYTQTMSIHAMVQDKAMRTTNQMDSGSRRTK